MGIKINFNFNSNFNQTRNVSARSVDIQAVQTYELPEDGQGLGPKHVGAITI
jgi:hypothetical protein